MKAWQHGIPLARLRHIAAAFEEGFRGYAQSAMSAPNKPQVAQELKTGSLVEIDDGYAIVRRPARRTTHRDFAQRRLTVRAGDVYVRRLAAPSVEDRLTEWLESLARETPRSGHAAWVEHFEEDRRVVGLLSAAGYRYVGSKVSAFSDLRGVYVAGRPPIECAIPANYEPADLLSLESLGVFLDEVELDAVRAELDHFGHSWTDHYSKYNRDQTWSAFALIGYDDDPAFIIKPGEMGAGWKRQHSDLMSARPRPTEAANQFPRTLQLAERLPGMKDRIRFMRLGAGGNLGRHSDISDRTAGTGDGMTVRLHVPIVTDPSVVFESWDHRGNLRRKRFRPGELFYLDHRKPHRVVNPSRSERIHLVIDTSSSEELRQILLGGWPGS